MALSVTVHVLLCLAVVNTNAKNCPPLGSAAQFTVIAASSVSSTGFTVINGNVAMSPSIALTGFHARGVINGVTTLGTGIALQAQKDVTSAYNYLKHAPLTARMTGVDLAGQILGPGVYKFNSAAGIDTPAGVLTLSGAGTYIFQVGSALMTSTDSRIRLVNGAKAGCIFWQVGSSATLGLNSVFVGNILAYASVMFSRGVTYNGSIYARTAAVSFISDTVTPQKSCNVC
uniref:Ice-binding family protein n=1 Tax=Adineta environmental sample TaxID=1193592 RepID=A0AAU7VFE0_9BILA